jgi:hypothetical protein
MTREQTLQAEIEHTKRWVNLEQDQGSYKRDLNWAIENMKDPNIQICELIEFKINEIIDRVNKIDSAIEADPLNKFS